MAARDHDGAAKITVEQSVRDPVCGMTVDPLEGKPTHHHRRRTFHFCSQRCHDRFAAEPEAFLIAEDPVCGMNVDRGTAEHLAKHQGQRFYFCSSRCKARFEGEPEKYLEGTPALEPMPKGTIYTCPMDPEIEQIGPGDCPICGMALEPLGIAAADEGPNPELVDFTRRLRVGALLTVPLVIIAMGPMLGLDVGGWMGERTARMAELLLATPVILWSGWPFLVRGVRSFRTMNLNMFSLIAMGVLAAWSFSIVAAIAPGIFPAGFRDHSGQVGVYFEAGGRDRRPGAARADPRAARARADGCRHPDIAGPRGKDRASGPVRWTRGGGAARTRSRSATASASGPARRSRSMARWSRDDPPSTSR